MAIDNQPQLPSQRELFLACLRPGNHVDLVLERDEDLGTVEVRGSTLHDLTRERKIILAQTSPPVSRSRIGKSIEVIFPLRLEDVPGGRWLQVGYKSTLLEIAADYRLSANITETVLVVNVPSRLDETSLRMHFRVTPPLEFGMKVLIGAAQLRKAINAEVPKLDCQVRSQLWNRQKHPKIVLRELTEALRVTLENVNRQVEDVRQASLADLSEGGAKLVHPLTWEYQPESKVELTLVWGDESLDVEAVVVRGGKIDIRAGSPMGFTSVRFDNPPAETHRRLARLVQDMLRRELVRRSEMED